MNQCSFNISYSLLSPNNRCSKLTFLGNHSTKRESLIENNEKKKTIDLDFLNENETDYQIKIKHEKSKPKLINQNENNDKIISRNKLSLDGNNFEDNLNDSIVKSRSILDNLTSGNKSTRKNSILNNTVNDPYIINHISPLSHRKENILLDKVKTKYESAGNYENSQMESTLISKDEFEKDDLKNESSIFENEIFALDILEKAYKIKPIIIPEKKEKKSGGFFGFFRIFKSCN